MDLIGIYKETVPVKISEIDNDCHEWVQAIYYEEHIHVGEESFLTGL